MLGFQNMFSSLVAISAVMISLYLWGLVRTALWLIPGIVLGMAWVSASLLGFWTSCSLLMTYKNNAFDARDWGREKIILLYFLSGVLGGTLLYGLVDLSPLIIFGSSSLIPFALYQIFKIFRHPLSWVIFAPKKLRFILPALWIIAWASRYLLIEGT